MKGYVALWLVVVAAVAVGCSASRPEISTGADGLRTYLTPDTGGIDVLCGGPSIVGDQPAGGVLAGDPNDRERVWLENGKWRYSVVWPEGFRVRFEPTAVVYRPDGVAVARAGDGVELTEAWVSHAGNFDDPYRFGECWEAVAP